MKGNTKRGFTLIELLVVVLIIGILAAVALPNYERALRRSEFTEAISNLSAIAKAEKVCSADGLGRRCTLREMGMELGTDGQTKSFKYTLSYNSPSGVPQVNYLYEDVCLCWNETEQEIQVNQTGSCSLPKPSMDYAKLLGLKTNSDCDCC